MEVLHCQKFFLEQNDLLCKVDLQDAYFAIPLNKESSKYVRFKWSGELYEFLCFYFGSGPAPEVFAKLLKILIVLLRWINIQIIVYLNDMLPMGQTFQKIMTARDTLIFLVQNLGFVISLKNSVLQPLKQLNVLGLQINAEETILPLSDEKLTHIIQQCQEV